MRDYTPAQQEYLNELSLSCPAHDSALEIIGRLGADLNEAMEATGVAGVDTPVSLVEAVRALVAERDDAIELLRGSNRIAADRRARLEAEQTDAKAEWATLLKDHVQVKAERDALKERHINSCACVWAPNGRPTSECGYHSNLRQELDRLTQENANWRDMMAEEAATTMELVKALGGTKEELHQPGVTSMGWMLARIAALRQAELALAERTP